MSDYQQYPPVPPPYYPQTSTLAIISLIAAILGWFALPLIGSVVAVITGHMAKNEIRSSLGRLTGEGLATAGQVMGYIQLGLLVLSLCVFLVFLAFGIGIPLCILPFTGQH